jgi:tRNA threonylcarbamoyl adenosine modification protein (Sua5/YciO/YrdC/YwlC family)
MTRVSQRFSLLDPDEAALGITAAVAAIRAGDLVVLPTDTVYGVAADPFSNPAVDRLLRAKDRGRETPPPVLVGSVGALQGLADDVDDRVERLVEKFWPGGLSLVLRVQPSVNWDLGETRDTVMLRMPDQDHTLQLLRRTGPLAVTSANRHGRPPATTVDHAEAELGDRVQVYLDGGPTPGDVPSTILDLTRITPQLLRRGVVTDDMLRELIPSMEVDIEGEPMPGEELLAEWEAEQARLDAEEAIAEAERERKIAAGELVDEEEVPFEPWPEGEGPDTEPADVHEDGHAEPVTYVELADRADDDGPPTSPDADSPDAGSPDGDSPDADSDASGAAAEGTAAPAPEPQPPAELPEFLEAVLTADPAETVATDDPEEAPLVDGTAAGEPDDGPAETRGSDPARDPSRHQD